MIKLRQLKETDEDLFLSVMTNQQWQEQKFKLTKQDLRQRVKAEFYDNYYGDNCQTNCVCLEGDENIILGFTVVYNDCLISHFVKSSLLEDEDLMKDIKTMLVLKTTFNRYKFAFNKKFAIIKGITRRVDHA